MKRDDQMENRCICCGEVIPEGRQVCPTCENDPRRTIENERKCKDETESDA